MPISRDDLRAVVREELREMHTFKSLRKNGDTWPGWFNKIFTVDRVVGAVILVFVFGGRVERYATDFTTTTEDVKSLKTAQSQLATDIAQFRGLITKYEDLFRTEQTHATKTDVNALSDRVSLTVTRQEYQAVIRQQILPRLDRIEKQLAGN